MPKPFQHILVIRLSAMGDVAMTIPVLRILSAKYPELKITVVSRLFFKPLFDEITNVHFVAAEVKEKHKGLLGLFRLSRTLYKLQIDAVADLHNVLRSNILKCYFSFFRLKVIQIDKGRTEKAALTRVKNKAYTPLKSTHQRYADVFEKLGFPIVLDSYMPPKKKEIPKTIHSLVGKDTGKWIGIAPFAAFKSKTYNLEHMQKVIAHIDALNTYKILLFGGGEKEIDLLNKMASSYKNVVNTAGILSFKEELNLISNLDLMLSMDSGNAHLAAIYGIKTMTLWGVTHPYAGFYPFAQDKNNALLADRSQYPLIPTSIYGNKFPPGYEEAINSIPPGAIVKKIEELLN